MHDIVTLDTVLKVVGLSLSLGGLLTARINRQKALAMFAACLFVTTGVGLALTIEHKREVSRVEAEMKLRLAANRWTYEDIRTAMGDVNPNPNLLREALEDAKEDGSIKENPDQCQTIDGFRSQIRLYFNATY